jgi:hypothetical protein
VVRAAATPVTPFGTFVGNTVSFSLDMVLIEQLAHIYAPWLVGIYQFDFDQGAVGLLPVIICERLGLLLSSLSGCGLEEMMVRFDFSSEKVGHRFPFWLT